MRTFKVGLLWVIAAVAVLATAYAAPGGATLNPATPNDNGVYPSPSAGTVDITSGHIYQTNLTTEMSTYHWAGIYGNASGTLVLGDTSSNKMFEWDAKASYVFFDDDNTVSWDNLDAATCTQVEGNFTFLQGTISDSCDETFTGTGDPAFKSIADNVANTIAANTYDSSATANWVTYALSDTSNADIVFAAEVKATADDAYDGTYSNYQVILPENGNNNDSNPTTYYVWIELY